MTLRLRRVTTCIAALAVAAVPLLGSAQIAAATGSSDHQQPRQRAGGYVAMGDSYSSGEGTGIYTRGTNSSTNQCHRSPLAYGPLISATTRNLGRFSFVACSSATTASLYVANAGRAPQLDALRPRTKLVTLTIGGNDAVFGTVAKACVESARTPGRFGCSKNPQLNGVIDARLAELAGTSAGSGAVVPVKKILTDIAAKSPRANIYLAGYPELFGNRRAQFSVDQSAPSGRSCVVNPSFAGRVDFTDTQFINTRTQQLNAVLRTAVQQAKAAGVKATFVPVGTFEGHGLCDAKASWIQPVLANSAAVIQPESLHPTRVGQSRGYFRAFQDAGVGASKN